MNIQFAGEIEAQVFKDWQRVFNKHASQRAVTTGTGLRQQVQRLVDELKRAF